MFVPRPLLLPVLIVAAPLASADSFYQETPLFSTAPKEEVTVNTIDRFGPVGMAVELHQPAFTMRVGDIEPGSPAEAAGGLEKGQIIETINGRALEGIDPRIQLGRIIETAEAGDGVLRLAVKDDADGAAREVVVRIPAIGAYSATWPLDCPKSDRIVRQFADYLARPDSHKGFAGFGMLFLLSTGDDRDLAPVREWVHSLVERGTSGYAWHIGYGGLAICEYYLRTGDPVALEVIQEWVDAAAAGEYIDGWAGRGGVTRLGYGAGHLNAAGTGVVTFLLLAKQCGADVDESLLHRTLSHFFRYAGRGCNPYGDDRPETSFVDNGKNGLLAFTMAAAASLTPEGEDSIYARARDHLAMSGFYTTTFMLHGHTGGGIGEIWRSAAMGLLHDTLPDQYRDFMDQRKWHYELSRRFDGSFGILGGARYDNLEWGACYPLAYTIPRRTLRITGAPPSEFSKPYQLPANPWGTEADEVFVSFDPPADPNGRRHHDVAAEKLTEMSARPLILRLNALDDVSDDDLRRYVHHPEFLIRNMVAAHAAGQSIDYMFRRPGSRVRPDLLLEFCRSPDPRVRDVGFRAAGNAFNANSEWSQEVFELAIERLGDDAESWWVKDAALAIVARGTPDMILPHIDLLLPYLQHSEQWLQNGALTALTVVATDERCYATVLPAVAEVFRTSQRISTIGGPHRALRGQLREAGQDVQALALEVLGVTYADYAGTRVWEGGQNLTRNYEEHIDVIAETLSQVPGGYDVLHQISRARFPDQPLPHKELFLAADPDRFGPDLQQAIKPTIRDELVYQYVGQNRRGILSDLRMNRQSASVTNSIDGLVDLYQRVGVDDYDWQPFGPDLRNAEWHYVTFDPPEQQPYDQSPWRYREVTYPGGMDHWFEPEFDPAGAGWGTGLPPFGQNRGELRSAFRGDEPRTLWEHEVLLVRGTFEFPELKPGHIYRLRVQTGQGVGSGCGFKVYVNGRELVEAPQGLGRRQGDTVRGGWITADFMEEFGNGPVTIAATSFLRYGTRAIVTMPPVPQGTFSLWLEERRLPPLDQEVFRKAASFIPMASSEWQANIDPESNEPVTDEGRFRFDGGFTANAAVPGRWTTVALVEDMEDFEPGQGSDPRRAPVRSLVFRDDGTTDDPRWIWSGDMLMDLDQYAALRITPRTIDGTDYLFVEAGGFSADHPAGWQPALMVMRREP